MKSTLYHLLLASLAFGLPACNESEEVPGEPDESVETSVSAPSPDSDPEPEAGVSDELAGELEDARAKLADAETALAEAQVTIAKLVQDNQRVTADYAAYREVWDRRSSDTGRKEESITLRDGRTFAPYMMVRMTDDQVYLQHQGGFEELGFSELPSDMEEKYAFQPADISSTTTMVAANSPSPVEDTTAPEPAPVAVSNSSDPLERFQALVASGQVDAKGRELADAKIAAKRVGELREELERSEASLETLIDPSKDESIPAMEEQVRTLELKIAEIQKREGDAKREIASMEKEISNLQNGGSGVRRAQADIDKMKRPIEEKIAALRQAVGAAALQAAELDTQKSGLSQTLYRNGREKFNLEAEIRGNSRALKAEEEKLIRFIAKATE